MDPYKVLGILPHSSTAEVQEAYKKVVETYNTDNLEDDSVKTFYLEKLSEANEAFRIINLNLTCQEVRDLIETDDIMSAESKLNLVSDLTSAEWNYLKGVLLLKKGWIDSGVNHIKAAVNLNPYNNEYVETMKQLNENVKRYKKNAHVANQKQNNSNLCGNNNGGNKGGLC